MTDEQTYNNEDRSAQVDGVLDELSQYRLPPRLLLRLAKIAEMAKKYEGILASKRKSMKRLRVEEPHRTTTNHIEPQRTAAYIREDTLTKTNVSKSKTNVSKKVYMPDTFSPNLEWAIADRGWNRAKAEGEAERFRGYAVAHGKKYANWDQAWRNWCRSPYQDQKQGELYETDKERRKREYREARAQLRAFGEGRNNGDFGGSTVRLLSGTGIGGGSEDVYGGGGESVLPISRGNYSEGG